MLYQGDILDGWNRQKACDELGVAARYQHFTGDDVEAIAYMMRTNKRRNLNSGQWATIAVEAEELVAAIRAKVGEKKGGRPVKSPFVYSCSKCDEVFDRDDIGHCSKCDHHYIAGDECGNCHATTIRKTVKKTGETLDKWIEKKTAGQRAAEAVEAADEMQKPRQKIASVSKDENKTAHKTAELFNTNRTYVNQAAKLKVEAPEVFEEVKAGRMRMTDAAKAVKAIPKDGWRPDERERQSLCKGGQSVVANASKDQNLIKWAEGEGKAVRIDRGTKYGNPFLLDSDGDRDQVCKCYEKHYLPHKPSIISDIGKLKGKVLVCHCYPLRCHGDTLAGKANEAGN
jgi:hypothetical protein